MRVSFFFWQVWFFDEVIEVNLFMITALNVLLAMIIVATGVENIYKVA